MRGIRLSMAPIKPANSKPTPKNLLGPRVLPMLKPPVTRRLRQKLSGAAKDSFTKKCVKDATGT